MALHERMKNAKIVEEIFGYFLEQNLKKITVSMEVKDDETTFLVELEKNEKAMEAFKKDLYCCRDVELEEYGWELVGETGCVCTLHTLGMLVDNYEINEVNDKSIIILHRKKRG